MDPVLQLRKQLSIRLRRGSSCLLFLIFLSHFVNYYLDGFQLLVVVLFNADLMLN